MKIKCTEEQGYYDLNDMSLTRDNTYEVIGATGPQETNLIVIGNDGYCVFLMPGEYVVEEE